jgi:hypothetical protein
VQEDHHKEHIMGFIKSGLFISLDGVIEAPETWHFPYFNDEMGAAVGQLMSEADATLLGRKTYEAFASYWPQADPADEMTATMNGARKYVVSNTLTEATWENSSVINDDVYASLATLKEDTDCRRPAVRHWSARYSNRASSTSCTCWCIRSSSATARSCSPTAKPCRST